MIIFFLFIQLYYSQTIQCKPKGTTFNEGFIENEDKCKQNSKERIFLIENDFSINSQTELNEMKILSQTNRMITLDFVNQWNTIHQLFEIQTTT